MMRTCLAVFAAVMATQAVAFPLSPIERVQVFATCAGRLSAQERQQWLTDGAASEETRYRLNAMLDLTEAVLPDALAQGLPEAEVMAWRLNARVHQTALLSDAMFSFDARRAEIAQKAADTYIATCTALILNA